MDEAEYDNQRFCRSLKRREGSLFAGETCMPLDLMSEVTWVSLLGGERGEVGGPRSSQVGLLDGRRNQKMQDDSTDWQI